MFIMATALKSQIFKSGDSYCLSLLWRLKASKNEVILEESFYVGHLSGNHHPQEDILKKLKKLAILVRKILATSSYEPDMKYNSLISLLCFMATH
jgi:hypothetical protein